MTLTDIIFWILSRLAPMLWYAHRLGYFLRVAVRVIEDESCLQWLADNPEGRARMEGMIADAEHVLDIIIGLKARECLGLAIPIDRPGLRRFARTHTAPSLDQLLLRTARLIARAQNVDRLARRRAARLRHERDAAPVLLAADHRPVKAPPATPLILVFCTSTRIFAPTAVPRIRAPPWLASNPEIQVHPNSQRASARSRSHARKNDGERRVHKRSAMHLFRGKWRDGALRASPSCTLRTRMTSAVRSATALAT